jgi:hypothetical protein
MKQFLATACLTVVALAAFVPTSDANGGLFRRGRGCNDCASAPCDAPCASVAAPAPAPAPAPIQYEDRKVKVVKNVWKDKEIEVLECRQVMSQEKYFYTVSVPVWNDVKRMVTVSTPVCKEVDYVYTIMTPKTLQKTVPCTTYTCTTEMVKEMVPVCRTVCVNYVDECGRCCTRRERVTEMQERTRCVVKRVPVVTERVVNYTVCEPVQHKGKKMVTEFVRSEKEVTERVCSFNQEKREGVRNVCNTVTEKVKRMVKVCEQVVTEEVVRVAINQPCEAPCAPACDDCGNGHGRRGLFGGGLFRRGGHGNRGCDGCN